MKGPARIFETSPITEVIRALGSDKDTVAGRGEARIEPGTVEHVPDALLHLWIASLLPGFVVKGETLGLAAHLVDTGPYRAKPLIRWIRARVVPQQIHIRGARECGTAGIEHLSGTIQQIARNQRRKRFDGRCHASWEIPLLSLQWIMKYAVHLGGESALDMAGYAHYLSLGGRPRVQFHGEVPSWLKRLPMQTEIVVRRRTLFGDDPVGIDDAGLEAGSSGALVDVWRWPIKASSPERAILEALDELPHRASFENLDKIFEGLVSLRPKQLMALLAACRSVKVRRLFLVFADRHEHGWRKYLDTSKIDLGSGPRALVEGGKLHPTYRIYVPEALVPRNPARANGDA